MFWRELGWDAEYLESRPRQEKADILTCFEAKYAYERQAQAKQQQQGH